MNQYMNPYPYMNPYQQNLPPQQILQANGKASIDALKLSPNSSCLIADSTAPIVWRCVADSLGNVTAEAFDITPHKDEEQKTQETMSMMVAEINERLKRLEDNYESIIKRHESGNAKYAADKTNVGNAQKRRQSTGNDRTDDAE